MDNINTYIKQLNKVLHLSQQMLVEAQREEWDNLNALEHDRQQLLPDFSRLSLSQEQAKQVRELIADVLQINQMILDISTSHQNEYRQSNRKFAAGKRAVSTYEGV